MEENKQENSAEVPQSASTASSTSRHLRPLSEASASDRELAKAASRKHWYVVRVQELHEKEICKAYRRAGIRYFLPLRKERHQWSDRVKTVDVVLSAGYIFVYITAKDRKRAFLEGNRYIKGFLMEPGKSFPAEVSSVAMASFIGAVRSAKNVCFEVGSCKAGDRFLILRGPMRGLVGVCIATKPGTKVLQLRIVGALSASFEIEPDNVQLLLPGQEVGYIDSYFKTDDEESWFVENLRE